MSNFPCIVDDSSEQYCYTLPDAYDMVDAFDNDPTFFHVDENFNAFNEIRFSKVCSGDWYYPGDANRRPDGSYGLHCDHPDFDSRLCDIPLLSSLIHAVPSPDGYVTTRNCPQCGCTSGQNDVITMNELEANERSLGSNHEDILAQLTEDLRAIQNE